MYVHCILRDKRNPQLPLTAKRLTGVYEAWEAKQAVQEYIKTLKKNRLVRATLMASSTKPIRTVYAEGLWYY